MKLSVITVCLNSIETIERAITSVLGQKDIALEYIIIDGNSSDGTQDIIRKYDKEIIWISEPDNGIYDAMNKGIKMATGDIISFLNSDDWYEDGALRIVCDYFAKSPVDIVSGAINWYENAMCRKLYGSDVIMEEMHLRLILPHQSLFAKRSLFQQIGNFDINYKIAADYDWMLRAYDSEASIIKVNDIFTNCYAGGVSSIRLVQCCLEQKAIALSHIPQKDSDIWERKITKYYAERKKEYEIEEQINDILQNDISEEMKLYLEFNDGCYIWGCGNDGGRCFYLFTRFDVKIVGFIDTYSEKSMLYGYKICRPDEVNEASKICIASSKYEKEIIKQLEDMGVSKKRIVTFAEVKEDIVKHKV